MTNVRNTIHGFKKLHGRSFDDPIVQTERIKLPYELQKMPNGSAGVKVSFVLPECTHRIKLKKPNTIISPTCT